MSHHDAFFQHLVVQKHSLKIITNSKKHLAHLEDNVQDSLQSLDLVKVCFEGMNIKLKNGIWCKPIITVLNDQGADSICAFMSAKRMRVWAILSCFDNPFCKAFLPCASMCLCFHIAAIKHKLFRQNLKTNRDSKSFTEFRVPFLDTELRFSDTEFRFSDTELRLSDT